MQRTYLSFVAFVLALFPVPLRAEYFVSGYPACVSEQKLDEFSTLAQSKSKEIYRYIDKWCIYPRDAVIRVLSMTFDDKAEVQFNSEGQETRLWVPVNAIRRLKPKPLTNVLIEDPDNPNIKDVCVMISVVVHQNNEQSSAIGSSIVVVQGLRRDSTEVQRYTKGLTTKAYQLVVDWDGQRCIAQLDVPKTQIVGCVLDPSKYYRCRRKQTNEAAECYIDLCMNRLAPNELQ